jgi:small-conductance mechanosensitive channel
MARHNQLKAQNSKGTLTLTEHNTDAPLLPVADMERFHQFRPDLVDFVVSQTAAEAGARRAEAVTTRNEQRRINTLIFAERIFGQVCALLVGFFGIGGGIYAGLNGQPWLGGVIASASIGTLAVAFLSKQSKTDGK